MTVFEITVTKWADVEGIEKQEIGRMVIRGEPIGSSFQEFTYQVDENAHPLVPVPLRARGTIGRYPVRQSVWNLIRAAAGLALFSRPN